MAAKRRPNEGNGCDGFCWRDAGGREELSQKRKMAKGRCGPPLRLGRKGREAPRRMVEKTEGEKKKQEKRLLRGNDIWRLGRVQKRPGKPER